MLFSLASPTLQVSRVSPVPGLLCLLGGPYPSEPRVRKAGRSQCRLHQIVTIHPSQNLSINCLDRKFYYIPAGKTTLQLFFNMMKSNRWTYNLSLLKEIVVTQLSIPKTGQSEPLPVLLLSLFKPLGSLEHGGLSNVEVHFKLRCVTCPHDDVSFSVVRFQVLTTFWHCEYIKFC